MSVPSSAFHRLHPKVQRWLWQQGWTELRDIQEAAIPAILPETSGGGDVVLAAATAAGKTEAAFLPILTALADHPGGSVQTLYVSPLKALINDQFQRLELLCAELEVPVHRWHGDVPASRKRRVLEQPGGILIITPESLEALFIVHGTRIQPLLGQLAFVVVDELHAFLETERGRQLQSLLHRVELAVRRRIPRVALSATLGDLGLAGDFLRPGQGAAVRRIVSQESRQELRIQVRGYRTLPPRLSAKAAEKAAAAGEPIDLEDEITGDTLEISRHLFERLRGGHHLIFANARGLVETYADLLRRQCDRLGVPNEFWAHHGNLSRDLREEAEAAIKDRSRPASAVCTTTLELGIDIGAIESVAQIGPPPSVASLRQRMGRSGRQGEPAVLRGYVQEPEVTPETPPHETLRASLVQTAAAVRLLAANWCEPPVAGALHLSTLVQQVLSMIAQHGGLLAGQAWRALCKDGPFTGVDPGLFAELLRSLGERGMIRQEPTGELLLDLKGERVVNHYSFFAAFQTPEEYRLTSGGRNLGRLPISQTLLPGISLIFGGRRWKVLHIDEENKVIDLAPARGGRTPGFLSGGKGARVHDRVVAEMLALYTSGDFPAFLDARARGLLTEGRESFARYGLASRRFLPWGEDTLLFAWRGDRVLDTLVVWCRGQGMAVSQEGVALVFEGSSPEEARRRLQEMAAGPPPGALDLAAAARNKVTEKFHPYLSEPLLTADYAAAHLDPAGAWEALRKVLG